MSDMDRLSLLVQVGVYVLTVGVFAETTRQVVRALTEAVQELKRRADGVDALLTGSQVDRGRINQRLDALEHDEELLRRLNDGLVELRAEMRTRIDHLERTADRTSREVQQAQRQLANLAAGRAGRGLAFAPEPGGPARPTPGDRT